MSLPPPRDVAWSAPSGQLPGRDLLVPVSVADGVVLVVWSILGQGLAVLILQLGLTLAGVDLTELAGPSLGAVTVLVQSLVLAGAFAWLAGRGRWSWRIFGAERAGARHVLLGLLGGLVAFLTSASIILLGDTFIGPLEGPGQALLETEMLAGPALALTFLAASVLAPLLEEVTFRGVLFQALGRRTTWLVGAVASSLVFSVVHVEVLLPLQLESLVFGVALFAVGMVFVVLFHRSRSLVTAMVAHATFNAIQIVLASQLPETVASVGFVGRGIGA